ncbi:MHC class II transactivator isoform X3 [Sinocyclocheilus rhinocerous]|uniref:MHC class II transactivator isoform X3 n=1 Tax=Sinocyclocheilus rhinocerous TaxID=307959 RepID=UPI0007BA282C|nr:PREDICTED: MHC class II transactivator-like isoform X3 [Sinocyclocheilus rhinocerous]
MSLSRGCCPVMVPFEEVLFQVRKALQVSPILLHELLRELHEANVFSTQYYQSLYKDGEIGEQRLCEVFCNDGEDLARRLSLPIWQNWDISQSILDLALSKEEDLVPSADAEWQDIVSDLMSELLPDNVILKYLESPESIEDDFDPTVLDNFPGDTDTTCTPIPENTTFLDGVPPKKPKVVHKRRRKRSNSTGNRKVCPESPSNGSTPIITPESSFHLSSNPFRHVLRIPFSPPLLPPSGGSPLQIIQTIGPYTPPLFGTVVPTGPTYVIVSPQCVSPGTQIIPLSPAIGTVAPPELTGSVLPVGSSSDSACQGSPTVDTLSPTKDLQKNIDSTSPKTEKKIRPEAPECVKDYIHHIKSYMRDVCCSMRGGMGMESHYVDAHLVQRKLLIKSGKNANKCLEKELVVLSDSERKKAKLDRSQLFHNSDSKPKQSVAILGKAGAGKTTFIQRLCLDWASGSLPQFQFVFLLNCKILDLTKSTYSLKGLLFDLSMSPRCEDSDSVFKHILSCPDEVLIIFDSFDHIKDFEGLLQSPAKSHTNTKYTIKQLFSGLFQKEILSGCTLLIATRPKDVLNQVLRKMDRLLELCGFSPEDIELYTSKYFGDASLQESALKQIKTDRYIFSLCSNPLLCWTTCFLLEHQESCNDLPSTLTDLYQRATSKHLQLASLENSSLCKNRKQLDIPQLCKMAWEGFKNHDTHVNPGSSTELLDCALKSGILASYKTSEGQENHFADLFTQNLLSAVHLVQSKQVNEKMVVANSVVHQKKRKVQGESQDVLQRFVTGLVFQKAPDGVSILDSSVNIKAKRKAVETHLESMKPNDLVPARLLELFHCVYKTSSAKFAKLLLKNLPDNLSFYGTQLCPSDVYVICHLLQYASTLKRTFSINLQDACISISGLKELVGLKCIKAFWAHTADTIGLWEDLHQSNDELNLKSAIEKFTLHPFKATEGYHIESLPVLVQIHREKKLPMSELVSALDKGVPALRHLQRLEFELGVQNGPELFPKLVEVLPSLRSLQHLDLEKNQIGDSGAEKLAGVLHFLECLKLLNLSQNLIGDAGVEKLAKALASVPSLQSLSLYGNAIADIGAEHLALALPDMNFLQDLNVAFNKFTDLGATKLGAALKNCTGMKSLELWNDCIPYGVFEHLRLQDPRIRSL